MRTGENSYRIAGKDQRQRAAEVAHEDQGRDSPHDHAVRLVVGALEQAQVTDEEGNFEEADAELVKGTAGIVDAGKGDEVLLGPEADGQAEAVFCFWLLSVLLLLAT